MRELIEGISHRPYREADFEEYYPVIQRAVGDAVRELDDGQWREPLQSDFFKTVLEKGLTNLLIKDGRIVGSFEIDIEESGEKGANVCLDMLYLDPAALTEQEREDIADAITKLALQRAHQWNLPLEVSPLINDPIRGFYESESGGFEKIAELVPYPPGSDLAKDFGWLRMVFMRHKDTFQYAPDREARTNGATDNYVSKPPQP